MDLDLLQARIEYFHDLDYIAFHSETKRHPLMKSSLMVVLKVFSMVHGLSFPRANAKNISDIDEIPDVYVTETGEKIFINHIKTMSVELFEMIAPIFKGHVSPETFILSEPRMYKNIKGEVGTTTRKNPKHPSTYHVLVDNDPPLEYLQGEYIYNSIYEARIFINKLVRYIPPSKLELWRRTTHPETGQERS